MKMLNKYLVKWYDSETGFEEEEVINGFTEGDVITALTEGIGDNWEEIIQIDSVEYLGIDESSKVCVY